MQRFLVEKVDSNWRDEEVFENGAYDTAVFGKNKFFKVDFDHNGLTDLIVNGKSLFVVIDKGHGKYQTHAVDKGMGLSSESTLLGILSVGDDAAIDVNIKRYSRDGGYSIRDTLIYRFGGLVEFNRHPSHLQIAQINFSTSVCFGFCPVFPDLSAFLFLI